MFWKFGGVAAGPSFGGHRLCLKPRSLGLPSQGDAAEAIVFVCLEAKDAAKERVKE